MMLHVELNFAIEIRDKKIFYNCVLYSNSNYHANTSLSIESDFVIEITKFGCATLNFSKYHDWYVHTNKYIVKSLSHSVR